MLIDRSKTYNTALILAAITMGVSSIVLIFPCWKFYQNPPKESLPNMDFSLEIVTSEDENANEAKLLTDHVTDVDILIAKQDHNITRAKSKENVSERRSLLQEG